MKYFVSLFTLIVLSYSSYGQTEVVFQNPSLEGTPQSHVVPAPWSACFGSPDTQPGTWGITKPPSHGSTYVSMLHGGDAANGYVEGMTQELAICLIAGQAYTLTFDLAFSETYSTAEPQNCYGSMEIVGGNTNCDSIELLWQSGMITDTSWQTYTVDFTPDSNLCFLTFRPYFIDSCAGYINCLIDNLNGSNYEVIIDSPQESDIFSCAPVIIQGRTDTAVNELILSGNFMGSPLNANLLTDTTWIDTLYYPYGFSGTTNVLATGIFQGDTANDEVNIDIIGLGIAAPEICLVSVDTNVNKNIIIWEKPITQEISQYTVYGESNQNGVYFPIADVDYDSLSTYIDLSSIPEQNSNSYKLSVTDTCGVETQLSTYHKTIHLLTYPGTGSSTNLVWNHYEGFAFPSYNIYRGSSISSLSLINTVASNINSYTDLNPPSGANYYLIEVVHPNGCNPTRNNNVSLSNISSINIITGLVDLNTSNVQVFPNPSKGLVNIMVPTNISKITCQVFDVLGKKLIAKSIQNSKCFLDISNLAIGTYYLKLSNEKSSVMKRLHLTK